MDKLLNKIESAKKSGISGTVGKRLREFRAKGKGSEDWIFNELCFCLLTANFNAERSIRIQNEIGEGFSKLNERQLALKLKELGHRFPNTRARFIVEARKHKKALKGVLALDEAKAREWLANNVRGLGMKEASHFLRNIGYTDSAIIDFHIIDVLEEHGIAEKPKTLSRAKYLEIEEVLRQIGKKARLDMAALDLYLWHMKTGKVLK